jgi:hypothetical protein
MVSQLTLFADLRSDIDPLFTSLMSLAGISAILFIVFGGYYYMSSSGNPERLDKAKKTLRNAFIGLVMIIGASGCMSILNNAYTQKPVYQAPTVSSQQDDKPSSLSDIVNKAVKEFIKDVVKSISEPVTKQLKEFTKATPLMAENKAVFNYWLVILGISDTLFLLIIALLGLKVMSATVLGFEDVELRSLIPQIVGTFLVVNISLFLIDMIITVSNAMITALLVGMSGDIVWATIGSLFSSIGSINIGLLLFVAVILIVGVILLIYYLMRIVALYVGAVLSPIILLLWLLPSFRDFSVAVIKRYIITIFVLFVHVAILLLAVSFFSSTAKGDSDNSFMSCLYSIAVLLTLLKTSSFMNQMAFAGSSNMSMRRLGSTFIRSASHMSSTVKSGFAAGGGAMAGSSAANSMTGFTPRGGSGSTPIVSSSNPGKFDRGSAAHNIIVQQKASTTTPIKETRIKETPAPQKTPLTVNERGSAVTSKQLKTPKGGVK